MTTQACMGGWCRIRERCPHYHAAQTRAPRERLCEPGHDGYQAQVPLAFIRPLERADLDRPEHRRAA